ncbi:DoxX family protein [Sphingobacterium spiritivorum]|uniref:DoxX family protein n=1 Tax=Sphingobacterium spiritivorum TaxID=258 RepID=UPI003DA255CD
MKLLILLFTAFFIALLAAKFMYGFWDFVFAGNLGMSVFIIFTGLSHFRFQKGMAMMMPDYIPAKMFFVYFTGVLEIAAGIGLMIPTLRALTAVLLIIFLIVVFIANVNSSKKMINIFKADYTGPGMNYLYAQRLPMQLILIGWTWYFGLYLK